MSFDPSYPNESRVKSWLRRRFPERLIYIRSGGDSRTIELSTGRQLLVTTALFGALAWTVYASAMHLAHNSILSNRATQVEVARAAHDELLAEVANYRAKVAEITQSLEKDYARAVSLATQGADIQKQVQATERRMGATNRSDAAKQKDMAQIEALESQYAALEKSRGEADRERTTLQAQLADLDARMRKVAETGKIDGETMELREAVLQRDMAISQRDKLVSENQHLGERLLHIQSAQKQILDQVSSLAEGGISQIEKTLKKTGLNVDELLDKQGLERGGPFIPADLPDLGRADLNSAMKDLSEQIDRWDGLSKLMEVLPLGYPVATPRVTSGFGYRRDPFTGELADHTGIDFRGEKGDVAYATAPGTVVYVGDRGNYGNVVEIDHGMGFMTRFGHLESALVKVGDEVQAGVRVGLIGNTGRSTGRHLHYEVRYNGQPYNPKDLIRVKRYVQKNQ